MRNMNLKCFEYFGPGSSKDFPYFRSNDVSELLDPPDLAVRDKLKVAMYFAQHPNPLLRVVDKTERFVDDVDAELNVTEFWPVGK